LELKWNLEKGYLTNRPWKKGDSIREEDMTYFQRKSWKLNDGSTMLDLGNFDDEMFYYMALDSKFIANSEKEWRGHKWPKATHYIAIENEADEIKYRKSRVKTKAFAMLESDDLTPSMKEKFCAILGLISSNSKVTEEQTHNLLFDWIEQSDYRPGSNIDKLTELTTLLETATGREDIEARYTLKRAIDNRVVFEKQGGYTWNKATGAIVLGDTYAEAIEFFLNPKKQALVEELEEEIKAKTIV